MIAIQDGQIDDLEARTGIKIPVRKAAALPQKKNEPLPCEPHDDERSILYLLAHYYQQRALVRQTLRD